MNLLDKVGRLVRYCGQYQSHGFMMDERNTDNDFNVELPEERKIRQHIDRIRVILLTGEAGDGKSRILRNIGELVQAHGFSQPCRDFSALTEQEKQQLIDRLKAVLTGDSQEKLVISANVGVFTQAVIKSDISLMDELTGGREDVFICNFEKRNLAEDREVFQNIVKQFLACDGDCPDTSCPCHADCAFRRNLKKLTQEDGLEAIRVICDAVYLTGGHITFRELLSLVAYTVTFGQDCRERRAQAEGLGEEEWKQFQETKLYYQIFEPSNDILLRKVSCMDPALKRGAYPADVRSRKDYIRYRRKVFFEKQKNSYQLLNVDYLERFYEVLKHINESPYYYDTVMDRNESLQLLKKGINRMCNQGKSDVGLIVTDSPAVFDKKIRTEFLVIQDIRMVWHKYDLQIGKKYQPDGKLWNKFYLSCIAGEGANRKLISLLIDYNQFRYLMMCSSDYFTNRSALTMEEYSVNTFYRKILEAKEHSYDSITVRFDDRVESQCDFSLKIHSEEDFFTGEKNQTILIRKED